MKSVKRLLKSPPVHRVMVGLIAAYIRLVFTTARKTFNVDPAAERYMRGEDNALFAFWHGRMMMMPCLCPPLRRMHVLISTHRDGIFIADVMRRFKFGIVQGSSNRNGRAALVAILRLLKAGDNVAITPDGPRGPFQIAAGGVAAAAKLSGKPVLPIVFSASAHKRAASWDRFMLAMPFCRIHFFVGAPIMITKSMPDEEARLAIECAMNQQTETADAALL